MSSLLAILAGEKAPYLITVLVAGIGWAVTHSVDRVLASPTLMYETRINHSGNINQYTITLNNITRDERFDDLTFTVLIRDGKCAGDPKVYPALPAPEIKQPPECQDAVVESQTNVADATFEIPQIHPGWSMDLVTNFYGEGAPHFRFQTKKDSVRLVRPSLETWFVVHEMWILGSLVALYFIFIVSIVLVSPRAI
jgi:hypothetical protein